MPSAKSPKSQTCQHSTAVHVASGIRPAEVLLPAHWCHHLQDQGHLDRHPAEHDCSCWVMDRNLVNELPEHTGPASAKMTRPGHIGVVHASLRRLRGEQHSSRGLAKLLCSAGPAGGKLGKPRPIWFGWTGPSDKAG